MGKKLIKDSPIRKSVVGEFISTPEESKAVTTEIQKSVNTEISKNTITEKHKTGNSSRTVKLTVIVPEDIDLLLEDIARKRRRETGKKPSKKSLIIEALRLLAEKEGIT